MFRAISCFRSPLHALHHSFTRLPQFSFNFYPTAQASIPSLFCPIYFQFSHTPFLQRHDQDSDNRDLDKPPRLFVVQPRIRPETLLRAKLDEALNLANSLEEQRDGFYETEFSEKEQPFHIIVQNPAARSPRADTYFGPGTVDTIKCHLNALESENGVDAVYVNASLTGIQQRNLERAWGKPVLDRVGLIIEIFNAHAQTKEAKLQAELAALMYKRSRLVRIRGPSGSYTFGATGEAEVVSARGRGSGSRGFISGAGETELELQRRRIIERKNQLLSEIKDIRRTRVLHRAARKRHGGAHGQELGTVAFVGYTNAGKSTLLSAISDTNLYCDDRLFATVDPKLTSVVLPSGKKVLLSDTVGFISDLPVQLVEAFHATLEEVVEADILVHVMDSSARNLDEQRDTVLQVLRQIGVSNEKLQNMIEVWNKIDLQEGVCYDAEGEADNCSSADDEDDVASKQLSEENIDECDKNKDLILSEAASEEAEVEISEHGDKSDGWLSSEDGQLMWDVHDDSTVGWENSDNEHGDSISRRVVGKQLPSGMESSSLVKTSAVSGVGLQKLLEFIDERLKTPKEVPERGIFYRKWRPPRVDDDGLAVER